MIIAVKYKNYNEMRAIISHEKKNCSKRVYMCG